MPSPPRFVDTRRLRDGSGATALHAAAGEADTGALITALLMEGGGSGVVRTLQRPVSAPPLGPTVFPWATIVGSVLVPVGAGLSVLSVTSTGDVVMQALACSRWVFAVVVVVVVAVVGRCSSRFCCCCCCCVRVCVCACARVACVECERIAECHACLGCCCCC
jgi:hypothetical protein